MSRLGYVDPFAAQAGIRKEPPEGQAQAQAQEAEKKIIKETEKEDGTAAQESIPGETEPKEDTEEESAENGATGFFGIPNIQFLNLSDFGSLGLGGPKPKVKKKDPDALKKQFDMAKIPRPHRIKEMLDEYVIGQDKAKKVISVAVYNHYKRVNADISETNKREIDKSNILMIGPTGCGKTYLVQTLARLLDVPLAIADATSLTEAGYIGDDIESVVSKLLTAAENDVERAECGIIFIDEIDKLARKKNATTRDVSGESVQQGMLKLLEGSTIEVPVGANSKNAMVPMAKINTKNILFICGGAFPDLDEIIKQRLRKETSIGFNAELKDKWDKEKNILSKVTVEDIKSFGMIPEFVGRMPIICSLEGLNEEALVRILKEPKNAITRQYEALLEMDEVKLEFTEEALHLIAKKALEKDTGARALRAVIEEFMLDIMFEVPKDDNIGRVIITGDFVEGKGSPTIVMRGMEQEALPRIGYANG
ncbi:MAG: ATP-dependent Clp protease ATP-binding subunit ClpX [Lachnospiraceae bacterium]|nr:ATP-dependent Clp protease ATP-binding subunit ClpX [Lachnospiraceae bacterium]